MENTTESLPHLSYREARYAVRHLRRLAGHRDHNPSGFATITPERKDRIEKAVGRLVAEAACDVLMEGVSDG